MENNESSDPGIVVLHLTPGELEYHRTVLERLSTAQIVLDAWMEHVQKKYKLPAGSFVGNDGSIALKKE